MLKHGKKDFLKLMIDFCSGVADYEIIHCPAHDTHDLTCKLYDGHYYCYRCGKYGLISSIKKFAMNTYKKKLEFFKRGTFVPFDHSMRGVKKKKPVDEIDI